MVFPAHGAGELIHDTAVAAVEVVLGILADQSDLRHGNLVKSEGVLQDDPGQDFQRSGRRQAGTSRNVPEDGDVQTVGQVEAPFLKGPHYALGIVGPGSCPGSFFVGNQIVQAGLQNTQGAEIHRIEAKPPVFPVPYYCVGAKSQGAGEHMAAVIVGVLADQIVAAVIVGVLADQIDSAGGKVGAKFSFRAVKFLKFFDQFV